MRDTHVASSVVDVLRSLFRFVIRVRRRRTTINVRPWHCSQRARTAVLRLPLRWTFVKHASGKLWTLVSTSRERPKHELIIKAQTMVKQPSNKQVKQRKETSATARRRSPPAPRLPSPSTTPATYTVALESVSEALDGLRNHARAGRTGCAQGPRRLDFAPPLRGRLRG